MNDRPLEGKVAIVTGGSRGIGRAIAMTLADAGASVALAARGRDALDETARAIEDRGGRVIGVPTDVAERGQVQELVTRTLDTFDTIDILVNNAGAAPFLSTVDQTHLLGFEKYFRLNFFSALSCTKAVAPTFLAKRSGCVLNIASVAGLTATPGLAYYGTAKAALISLTKTAALEWATSGVRVNTIAPGWIETQMNEIVRKNPEFLRSTLAAIPLGRWGQPEDVAGAALFLCSPEAAWITGIVLVVDGGQLLHGAGEW
jgi:NAD(P)-dependent dehydrogenase (short-subunit alcohol dehydrogenase family)